MFLIIIVHPLSHMFTHAQVSAYEARARVTLPPSIQAQADAKLQALNEQLRRKGTARKEVEIHPLQLYGSGNDPSSSSSSAGANADARFSDLLRGGGGGGATENPNEHDDGMDDDEGDFLSDAEIDRLERPQVCLECAFLRNIFFYNIFSVVIFIAFCLSIPHIVCPSRCLFVLLSVICSRLVPLICAWPRPADCRARHERGGVRAAGERRTHVAIRRYVWRRRRRRRVECERQGGARCVRGRRESGEKISSLHFNVSSLFVLAVPVL
jgi:hypothetical protein